MAARSSSTFIRSVLLAAVLGGAVVGLLVGMEATAHKWQVEGLTVPDVAYMASAVGALLIIAGCFAARTNAKKIPFVSMILGFVILGIAFNGLTRDFAGRISEVFLWASGCSFGAAIGLFLARWMAHRAERTEDK